MRVFSMLLIFLPFASIGQLTKLKDDSRLVLGKIEKNGIPFASITYSVKDSDTTYVFQYRNAEYKNIVDFKGVAFSGENGTIEALYSAMKQIVKSKPKTEQSFELGFDKISLIAFQEQTTPKLMVYVTDKGYCVLSDKEIDLLFKR